MATGTAYPLMATQEENLRKGPWLEEEDEQLIAAIGALGERRWDSLAKASGLRRSGKSCRLRWMNYLRPNLKHGHITSEEERLIIQLHSQWGNKWSKIAQRLPGRTDNEIKNYWRCRLRKRARTVQEEDDECFNHTISISDNNNRSKCEVVSPCSSNEDSILMRSSSQITSAADELSSYALTPSSPYEKESWCNSLESSLCYPEYISGSNDITLWDSSSDSIWNM